MILNARRPSRNRKGQFVTGEHYSPNTEFKKGEHWRKEKPYWNKEWLEKEYVLKSSGDIAKEFGVTEAAIIFWLRKHQISRRTISESRLIKHWGSGGEDNPMFGKAGELNPNWNGGCTPDRQSFYASMKWKQACSAVYNRDGAKCVRCGELNNLHVHHIESFANKEKRSDINNLVLLCVKCHRFVHSKKNINKEYIREEVSG